MRRRKRSETEGLRETVQLLERINEGIMKNSRILLMQKLQILNEMKSKNKNRDRREGQTDG
jgi:hypothetical protein